MLPVGVNVPTGCAITNEALAVSANSRRSRMLQGWSSSRTETSLRGL
jgi:hypothetical protein